MGARRFLCGRAPALVLGSACVCAGSLRDGIAGTDNEVIGIGDDKGIGDDEGTGGDEGIGSDEGIDGDSVEEDGGRDGGDVAGADCCKDTATDMAEDETDSCGEDHCGEDGCGEGGGCKEGKCGEDEVCGEANNCSEADNCWEDDVCGEDEIYGRNEVCSGSGGPGMGGNHSVEDSVGAGVVDGSEGGGNQDGVSGTAREVWGYSDGRSWSGKGAGKSGDGAVGPWRLYVARLGDKAGAIIPDGSCTMSVDGSSMNGLGSVKGCAGSGLIASCSIPVNDTSVAR